MKSILIILIFAMTACSNFPGENTGTVSTDTIPKSDTTIQKTVDHFWTERSEISTEDAKRESFDSANFSVLRRRYDSRALRIEVYGNNLTKLDNWKMFYENGNIKEEGVMTTSNHIPVGTWKYYSSTGKLDSTVNYDLNYPISYFKALSIAEKKGFKMPEIEISLTLEGKKTYWEVVRWKEDAGTGESILINAKTGAVTKSNNIFIRVSDALPSHHL